MISGAGGAVIIGLSKSIDRQQVRDLVEVRPGWTLLAASASGRVMADRVGQADLIIVEDCLAHVELVVDAVLAMETPPSLAVLSTRSPSLVARELRCSPHDVVGLVPGVSLNTGILRVFGTAEARRSRRAMRTPAPVPPTPRSPSTPLRPTTFGVTPPRISGTPPATDPARPRTLRKFGGQPFKRELLLIGASTGGPDALGMVLSGLPSGFAPPILITQHMPRTFTELLAATLDRSTPFTVREAKTGDVATSGCVYIAPGGSHMVLQDRLGTIAVTDDPPENNCRPSVDVMFRSAAETYGRTCVAVVLTGMGADGAIGAAVLAELGAHVIAQDRDTSVVWGMPGAVVQRDAADEVVPLKEIAAAISLQFGRPALGRAGATSTPSSTASGKSPSSV